MSTTGWIKLSRKIKTWKYYNEPFYFHIFMDLLLSANYEDSKLPSGEIVERGCTIISIANLSKQFNITTRKVRTILNNLVNCGSISLETNNRFTKVCICNYEEYQGEETTKSSKSLKKTTKSSPKKKSTPEPISFNDPIIQSKEQDILGDLDAISFWNTLLNIYTPENDKSLHNPSLKKDRERVIKTFTQEEKDKITFLFTKFKPQLSIVKPWIGNFFKEHRTLEQVEAYFRSIKDVKENYTTDKNKPKDPSAVKIGKTISNF